MNDILFGNYNSATAQYCLVPLKNSEENSINAFRGIFELAFNAGKGEETSLPQAIATIIEMGRGRSQERLDADFTTLQTEYLQLQQETERLKRYQNHQGDYANLKQTFDDISHRFGEYSVAYAVLSHVLNQSQNAHSEQEQQLNQKLSELRNQEYPLSEYLENLRTEETQLTANQKTFQTKLATHEQEIQQIHTLASEHSGLINKAIVNLTAQFEKVDKLLQDIDNFDNLNTSLKQAQRAQETTQQKIQQLTQTKNNHQQLLINQFSTQTASILYKTSFQTKKEIWYNTDFIKITATT